MRLAGLYTATRGPHFFWLEKTRSAGASDGVQAMPQRGSSASLVNMVHYEDAAAATIAAAKATGSFVYLPFSLMRPNGKVSGTVAQSCAEVSSLPVTTSLSQERRSVGLLWLPGCTRGAPCQRYDPVCFGGMFRSLLTDCPFCIILATVQFCGSIDQQGVRQLAHSEAAGLGASPHLISRIHAPPGR